MNLREPFSVTQEDLLCYGICIVQYKSVPYVVLFISFSVFFGPVSPTQVTGYDICATHSTTHMNKNIGE